MQGSQMGETVYLKEITDQVKQMLVTKGDADRVNALEHEKANKTDTEICLKWVDLLHKMVK